MTDDILPLGRLSLMPCKTQSVCGQSTSTPYFFFCWDIPRPCQECVQPCVFQLASRAGFSLRGLAPRSDLRCIELEDKRQASAHREVAHPSQVHALALREVAAPGVAVQHHRPVTYWVALHLLCGCHILHQVLTLMLDDLASPERDLLLHRRQQQTQRPQQAFSAPQHAACQVQCWSGHSWQLKKQPGGDTAVDIQRPHRLHLALRPSAQQTAWALHCGHREPEGTTCQPECTLASCK